MSNGKGWGILLLAIFAYLFFTFSSRYFYTTDSLPINLTTFNILFEKRFDLDNYRQELLKKGLILSTKENVQKGM